MKIQIEIQHLPSGEIFHSETFEVNGEDINEIKDIFRSDKGNLNMTDGYGHNLYFSPHVLKNSVKKIRYV